MEIVIKVLQFFMSLSLLVGIHEFGHYIMARVFKIRVEKFYIFFDPWFSLFKWKRGETEYGVGWLPLGGYVKIAGMIDESMDLEQMKAPVQEWEFRAKPAWQRFLVMIAGVVMNVLMALLIYTGIRYTHGESYLANDDIKWGYEFNEAGEKLGFVDGDKILSIDGEKIVDVNEIRSKLLLTEQGRTVEILRNGQTQNLEISFDALLDMRRNRGFEDLYLPRVPFIVDSISFASAAESGLQVGDEVVAFNGDANLSAIKITSLLKEKYKNDTVNLVVARAGENVELKVPVNGEGRIGVVLKADLFQPRTKTYNLVQAVPAEIGRAHV